MRKLLGIVVLLLASTAFAQERYDVSCQNVAKIEIIRVKDTYWNVESYQGCFHVLYMDLQPEGAQALGKLLRRVPTLHVWYRGEGYSPPDILVTANGVPLRNDVPAIAGFMEGGIAIAIVHEADAFAAARSVCPALVSDEVLIDGRVKKTEPGGVHP